LGPLGHADLETRPSPLEEVVGRARRREKKTQDVPLAITLEKRQAAPVTFEAGLRAAPNELAFKLARSWARIAL
jgi:hypothetical protein